MPVTLCFAILLHSDSQVPAVMLAMRHVYFGLPANITISFGTCLTQNAFCFSLQLFVPFIGTLRSELQENSCSEGTVVS